MSDCKIERLELALRMQKRMTQESRQEAIRAREDLDAAREEVSKLEESIVEQAKEIEFLRGDAITKTQLALAEAQRAIDQKDELISALQQRLANINQEFNKSFGRYQGRPQSPPQDSRQPRGHTTLEDVYRMTGEGNVRQNDKN